MGPGNERLKTWRHSVQADTSLFYRQHTIVREELAQGLAHTQVVVFVALIMSTASNGREVENVTLVVSVLLVSERREGREFLCDTHGGWRYG